jgi:hypothetical protein
LVVCGALILEHPHARHSPLKKVLQDPQWGPLAAGRTAPKYFWAEEIVTSWVRMNVFFTAH